MEKPKKTKEEDEEFKEKRRLAARQRRERIKNDPVLYQQWREKEKERYNKRKTDKKLLPISEMSPKNRKRTQKRNRDNFRAFYKRKKEKEKLKTIKEEVVVNLEELDNSITDPLETLSTPLQLNDSSYSLRSKNISKTSLITSTPRPSSALSSSSTDNLPLLSKIEQLTENKDTSMERASSLCSTPISLNSKRTIEKRKRKKVSTLLLLRRHIYETNKEMLHMRKKIEELKRAKEKYRKQALRLKYENTLLLELKQSHEKENDQSTVGPR